MGKLSSLYKVNIREFISTSPKLLLKCDQVHTIFEANMSLDKQDVEKIAHLARLDINQSDVSAYAQNLSNILDLVEQMNSVNTDDVEPMAHPTDAVQRLREDEVRETNQRERFQKIAPQVENGLYLVPKVIE